MKNTFKVATLILLLLTIIACVRTEPLRNIENQAINFDLPMRDVETAILKAGLESGWEMMVAKPGLIHATLNLRAHKALVDISYNDKTYSIIYKNSVNLLYEDGQIHKHYNVWVAALDQRIQVNLIEARPK